MKTIQTLFLFVFTVLGINIISAQYGNGYNNGYGGNGYGRGNGMGMDNSMMQGQQGNTNKPKELLVEEIATQIVEQMKVEINLDELQTIAVTNVLADSLREQGILLKNENSSQDQKLKEINALREETDKKVNAFLNADQVEKYKTFTANFKDAKKPKKKKSREEVKKSSEFKTKPTE